MARLTIYKDNQENATVVSNLFIDEYMKDANDAQLKVYLYLLRMMNAKQATSVSDIADKFNHTEKDIIRALKYWEKQQLMELDFDQDKTLVGIHMHTPEEGAFPQCFSCREICSLFRGDCPCSPGVHSSSGSPFYEARLFC